MKRGEIYLVSRPKGDPKQRRVYVVVSAQRLLDSPFPAVVCAPVHSHGEALRTQVKVGVAEGLKHNSWVLCDALTSLYRHQLTNRLGMLSEQKLTDLNDALKIALDII